MDIFNGKTALITGASSGIGEEMARQLAGAGSNLVLVARRTGRLETLAGQLQGVQVAVITMDLSEPAAPQALMEAVVQRGLQVDILVNNAGFGYQKPLLGMTLEDQLGMVDVNDRALLALTRLFAEPMAQRGQGWVLNVGSVSAWFPIPGMAVYAASKAFVQTLGRALHEELKPAGIIVTTLSPGGTRTEFSRKARGQMDPTLEKAMMPVAPVARAGLVGLARGRAVVVPGVLYQVMTAVTRLLPGSWVVRLAGRVMGRHH
ncbi:short-chain acyl CoA dehydrogenase [Alcanivorax hongdengensis A-11-3]|uniref:Short-chain acyl CoA dehydrogenase n=1 Tax=Alcanivorax hongdengensis A-11-3 TaxID=1177179 RepID=L0WDZ8_9GAMM|nr:SDR family oxidoreductase [Alcanivorax hongdengensis]EKF75058.1 short-chain acyl CoA dehydrogenase [Alcanivorax hongdengensis A-11-3]